VRDLPRQLNIEELAELFGGHTRLVELLAQRADPFGEAREVTLKGLSGSYRLHAVEWDSVGAGAG